MKNKENLLDVVKKNKEEINFLRVGINVLIIGVFFNLYYLLLNYKNFFDSVMNQGYINYNSLIFKENVIKIPEMIEPNVLFFIGVIILYLGMMEIDLYFKNKK